MTRRLLAAVALAALLGPIRVRAGCNVIPDPPVFFAGERGFIDRAFLVPGEEVRISIDRRGGSPGILDVNGDGRVDDGDVIVAIAFRALTGRSGSTIFIARRPLDGGSCWLKERLCPGHSSRVSPAEARLTVQTTSDASVVDFLFPARDAAGPVVIAIGRSDQAVPRDLDVTGCGKGHPELLACIDHVTAATPSPSDVSTSPTQLIALPKSNDFQGVCGHDVAWPHCKGSAKEVVCTLDDQGNALIDVKWRGVLRAAGSRRNVRGSSAVRAFANAPGRIFIPNSDYLATSTTAGLTFGTPPLFVADDLPTRPNELTLSGQTDKGESVLLIQRRRAWRSQCAGGSSAGDACDPNDTPTDCPSSSCVSLYTPAYFTCVGGSRATLPCTRNKDCRGGRCHLGSTCFTPQGTSTGTPCMRDADCAQGQECGPGLFEFRGRLTNGQYHVPRVVNSASEGGVCDGGGRDAEVCSAASQCDDPTFGSFDCVGYRAEALDFQ
jgi:hypothetical protein